MHQKLKMYSKKNMLFFTNIIHMIIKLKAILNIIPKFYKN